MGWIGCVRREKLRCVFVARTFALVRNVLPRVLQGNRMVANAPKWYEMHQNMCLGSNGVDRVGSLRNILMRLRGTNFCTSSARFATSLVRQPNGPKCTQMVRNAPKHEFRVQWSGSIPFIAKNSDATSWNELFISCTSSARFAPSSSINETIQNAPKHYETQQYMSLGSNRVGRVHSLRKIPKRLHSTNLCINCTSSTRLAPSFV